MTYHMVSEPISVSPCCGTGYELDTAIDTYICLRCGNRFDKPLVDEGSEDDDSEQYDVVEPQPEDR